MTKAASTNKKVVLGSLIAAGVLLSVSIGKKVMKIKNNLMITLGVPQIFGVTGSSLRVIFKLKVTNATGFDLDLKNFFIKLQYKDSSGWEDLGNSPSSQEVIIRNGESKVFDFPIDLDILTLISEVIKGKLNEFKFTASYDYQHFPLSSEFDFKLSDYINLKNLNWNAIKGATNDLLKKIGLKGFSSYSMPIYSTGSQQQIMSAL